jgi:hypothetical protein
LFVSISTIVLCVGFNRYYNHDIGGIYWPYLSDTAKLNPESAIFALGFTLTAVMIAFAVTLNYGKVKRDIEIYGITDRRGIKRNRTALVFGLLASPFLGLLACFDTARSPELHLIFVLGFFPLMLAYVFINTSIYSTLLSLRTSPRQNSSNGRKQSSPATLSLQRLEKSYHLKKRVSLALLIFVTLYLPVGMSLVTDWYNYSNDCAIHTFRAVMQHCSVLCIMLYFGTFWYDFDALRMTVVQSN